MSMHPYLTRVQPRVVAYAPWPGLLAASENTEQETGETWRSSEVIRELSTGWPARKASTSPPHKRIEPALFSNTAP